MGLTQDQKAAIGCHYITEIKARIEIRAKAKERITSPAPEEEDDTDGPASKDKAIQATALRIARRITPSTKHPPKAWAASEYVASEHRAGFWMTFDGHHVFVSETLSPELIAARKKQKASDELKGQLCQEIEFLTRRALAPSTVAAFQSHAARLLSLKPKDIAGPNVVRALLDDFLVSKRDFVCTLK